MFTPLSPSAAVSCASAPGRSGIGTWITATPERTCGLAARVSRAALAAANARSTSAARPLADQVAHPGQAGHVQVDGLGDRRAVRQQDVAPQRRVRRGEPRQVAEAAGRQQQDLRLVRLLVPPRGPSETVDATCGRWLTNPTSRSCRAGSIRTGRAPIARDPGLEPVHAAGVGRRVGVSTQTMSSTTEAEAWSGPERSDPPMGWPPTNRGERPRRRPRRHLADDDAPSRFRRR